MKEYDVKITETLEKTVTVEAKSRADAEEQVRSAYYNSKYILDSENFTGVEFGTTEEREIQQEQAETMTVLLVKPHMYPQQVQIGCDLEDLQKAVGGDIEAVYPFNEPVALVMVCLRFSAKPPQYLPICVRKSEKLVMCTVLTSIKMICRLHLIFLICSRVRKRALPTH